MNGSEYGDFFHQLADALELDPDVVTSSYELPESKWDSVGILATMAMIDQKYGKDIRPEALGKCKTPLDIANMVFTLAQ